MTASKSDSWDLRAISRLAHTCNAHLKGQTSNTRTETQSHAEFFSTAVLLCFLLKLQQLEFRTKNPSQTTLLKATGRTSARIPYNPHGSKVRPKLLAQAKPDSPSGCCRRRAGLLLVARKGQHPNSPYTNTGNLPCIADQIKETRLPGLRLVNDSVKCKLLRQTASQDNFAKHPLMHGWYLLEAVINETLTSGLTLRRCLQGDSRRGPKPHRLQP